MILAKSTRLRSAFPFRPHLQLLEDRLVPATFHVTTTSDVVDATDGKQSLREAITRANTTAGADVIVLPAGVFRISREGDSEDSNLTGDLDITDTVRIQGAGQYRTFFDSQLLDRVFDVAGSAPGSIMVEFQNATIRNGRITGNGGGIHVGNANLVLRDCVVTRCRASGEGGGISNSNAPGTGNVTLVRTMVVGNSTGVAGGGINLFGDGSALTIKGSTLRRNVAGDRGGGIRASSAIVSNSTVSGNFATNGIGGGILSSTATISRSTISGNSALSGGGIFSISSVTLTNTTVSANTATGEFGGGVITVGTATLTNCTINDNAARRDGGGINAVAAILTNCTISGNTAGDFGGGIWAMGANLVNCTIVENLAHTGGGLYHDPGNSFTLQNSIVALNLVDFGGMGADIFGAFTSLGHNLIGDRAEGTGFVEGANDDIVGTPGHEIEPKLGPLANNGGLTRTHALLAGSPAIDAGENEEAPTTDQRGAGFARKKDGNGDGRAVVDIGAFER